MLQDVCDALIDRPARVDPDLRCRRRLVGCRDSAEFRDIAGSSLRIETLDISGLTYLDRCVDEHLDELPRAVQRPNRVPVGLVRRDEGREYDQPGVLKEATNLPDAPDVLGAVFGRETEITVETEADIVSVEHVARNTLVDEGPLETVIERAFRVAVASCP